MVHGLWSLSYIESILLGLVQGLGEFLPISSSAHLVILPWFMDFKDPGLTFSVALHFGTLLAIVTYFWKDWWEILSGSCGYMRARFKQKDVSEISFARFRLLIYLVIATIPGALAGLLLEDVAETLFRNPLLVAANMALFGGLLWAVDKWGKRTQDLSKISWSAGLLIGVSQALALVPGVSRSGATMTMGLCLGLDRVSSARFSFLMATPITLGACILKAPDFFSGDITLHVLSGILVSAIIGFLAIKFLMSFVQRHSYNLFVYYRFAFFVFVVGYALWR
jgi:undecaprenyl-diphosphatase